MSCFRHIGTDRTAEFLAKGFKQRWVFPHRVYYLPKCGPDGFKLATRMLGSTDLDACWEVVLYADASAIAEFPSDLFFDRDLVWHQQHFGRPGQIASANLVVQHGHVHSMVHVSDVVQRISRVRPHKTRIEKQFEGWVPMLVNAIFNFARETGARTVAFATADLALRHTDPARHPQREMFERIYDRRLRDIADVTRDGDWWQADVASHANRTVVPTPAREPIASTKIICVAHDIERGLGHIGVDAARVAHADAHASRYLDEMLTIEHDAGIRATYNIVGRLLDDMRPRIEACGHALGFHSFDHADNSGSRWRRWWRDAAGGQQLERCREVDYRIRGYRPPQSRLTRELTHERLCYHNFEWLATSRAKLGNLREPVLERRLVTIPIALDDYALYRGVMTYQDWEQQLLATVEASPFTAVSLHDCYGDFWLDHYPRLLDALQSRGTLRTFDEVADEAIVTNAAGPAA